MAYHQKEKKYKAYL
uniref:Protein NUCLEAR FUSION DEFECTIVE 4-like n=1 Tax=Rhizophora mucronata TaxID=61149 RepID=A0A2P2QEA8_RHIMU